MFARLPEFKSDDNKNKLQVQNGFRSKCEIKLVFGFLKIDFY